MRLINGAEGEILKKYSKWKIPNKKDENYIERMLSTGLMGKIYDFNSKQIYIKTTSLSLRCAD